MSKQIQDAYIVAATRLPVGKRNGMFRHVRPDDMLAAVIKAVVAQVPGIDPARVGDVIVGCAMPEAEQGMNVARIGVLLAGLPITVPGMTINRFCSSGVQAVADAAAQIRLGLADVMIAAGTESMSVMPQIMGNKMAMNNIRERLQLHFDAEASLRTSIENHAYQVHIVLPYRTAPA